MNAVKPLRMNISPISILTEKCFVTIVAFLTLANISFAQDCYQNFVPSSQANLIECDPALPVCLTSEIQIDSLFLVLQETSDDPCIPGTEMIADLWAVVNNPTEWTESIGLFGQVSSESLNCNISTCSGPLLPMSQTDDGLGLQNIQFGTVNYVCGELVSLSDAILVVANECPIACDDTACSYAVPTLAITPPSFPEECEVSISVTCDDMNPCTVEDFEIVDLFTGAICMPCTGSGTADCYISTIIPCNDNNPCTINDMQSIDACSGDICSPCTGTPIASCSIFVNQACNDNDPCTENDIIVLDACSLEICVPCAGTPLMEPICDPNCFIYNPLTCSCDPIPVDTCNDNDCSTIDTYDPDTCECVHIDITPDLCDDGLCYTNDYLDPDTCNCVNEPIVVDCNDYNCATEDIFNYTTCECEYIDVCNNVSSGGYIGYDQGNCTAFDPAPIQNIQAASGGCGTIQYMWLMSPVNTPYTGLPGSPWTIIPGETNIYYDPPVITSGTMCFLRCARTDSCEEFPGESNVVCITVGAAQVCDDWDCTTEDYFNPNTCECEFTPISDPSCDDNNCGTEDSFNAQTCECEYTPVCNNVTFPGTIASNQVSCGPFDPDPIISTNLPAGGCGDIEYIWIQSNTNVFSNGGTGTPWTTIPGATGPSYDPGFLSQTTYFRRCARSSGCLYYIGESNIITIEVTQSETCDDGNCNTLDTYDPLTCECTHIDITPDCNDNNCNTEDVYDALTCTCSHIPIPPPDCDDNDCNTEDSYDEINCNCVHTFIPPPDCDDDNCATTDLYDVVTCTCVNVINPPLDCDDMDCSTIDTYNNLTCECEYESIELPDCDDDDCLTIDEYDPETCECTHTSIEEDNCDDNDCNTMDSYDTTICECVFTVIPPPDCDDNNCNTTDSYNSETCLCENIVIDIPDCDDNDCNTEDFYDVTICDCVNTMIPPPDCDDNDCTTEDSYDSATCNCVNVVLTPPDCDDNDCNTEDFYNTATCECMNTLIQIPDCDDNDCNTEDFYDATICDCVHTLIPPPDCDDNDCGTEDSYNAMNCMCENIPIDIPDCDDNDCNTEDTYDTATCECVNTLIPPPDCDDNDCNTEDTYDSATCECVNTLIPPPDCDDNDCNTEDTYDSTICECVNTVIPPPDCDDNDCTTMDIYNFETCNCEFIVMTEEIMCNTVGSIDIFLDEDGNAFITVDDIDNGSTAGCAGTPTLSLNITDFSCNNIGSNEVTLTVAMGTEFETCTAIVNVLDDIPPTVLPGFCPADVTISCDDDLSDLSDYGNIDLNQLDDNCPLAYTIDESEVFDLDVCGAGTITRTLTLLDIPGNIVFDNNGDQIVCIHTITVEGDALPLTLADITFPDSPIAIDCNDAIPDSEVMIADGGFACANVTTEVEEEIIGQVGDCNYTIQRTFTVTDNCQTSGNVFSFVQSINVSDNTAPTINDVPDDFDIDLTGTGNECSTIVTLTYNVTDDCVDPEDLVFTLDAPGFISQSTITNDGTVSFDVEFCSLDTEVTVTLTASDGCGNETTAVTEVTVNGGECITYSCQKFIFALDNDGSSDFISNDFPVVDNLCDHVDIEISYDPMDIQDTLLTLNCDSIINNGFNPNINQFLYFWLDGELIDSCRIVVFFSNDPNGDGDSSDGWTGICGIGNTQNISGTITSIFDQPIQDVEVNLIGSPMPPVMTGSVGDYMFPVAESGGNFTLAPEKDDNHLNGVSTLDIILIQRHILGLSEFDSPYKYIAADVNNSRSISALDLINVRKLILGINDEFPNNKSWRMIKSDYNFIDPSKPLVSEWPETYYISNLETNMFVEFTGIKVGDVNGSALNQLVEENLELRSSKTCELGFEESSFEEGEFVEVDLTIQNTESLEGMQFTFALDPNIVSISEVIYNDALCSENNVNIIDRNNGLISVSWNTIAELTDEERLLTLRLNTKKSGALSEVFSISEKHITPESYYNGSIGNLELVPKSPTQGNVVLYQNRPNPWLQSTSIQYYLPQAEEVELSIYSINGGLIVNETIDSQKGLNEFKLDRTIINQTGVFYYELKTSRSKQVKKMLILE